MASKIHPADNPDESFRRPSGSGSSSNSCTQQVASLRFLIMVSIPFAWLLVLTLVDVLSADEYLRDPAISAPSVVIAFLLCECRDVAICGSCGGAISDDDVHLTAYDQEKPSRTAAMSCASLLAATCRALGGGGHGSSSSFLGSRDNKRLTLLVLHVVAAWYAALRVALTPASRLGIEIVHAVLLYVALLLPTLLRWRSSARLPARVSELEVMLSEAKVQYDAVCVLLQRRVNGEDEESEMEGDDREHLIVPPTPTIISDEARGKPELALPHALDGLSFDRAAALKICTRIRKKSYSLAMFYDDVRTAFPELTLYLACQQAAPAVGEDSITAGKPAVTSGLSSDDEYRRTIGALFAVYWLMRIGIDGERGFSFGVDEQWHPHERPVLEDGKSSAPPPSEGPARAAPPGSAPTMSLQPPPVLKDAAKRVAFHDTQDWGHLQQLLIDSGMLETDASEPLGVKVNVERTMAMLALTAFHDVMKVQALLPAVAVAHAPYLGFKAGDIINDHDIALGYVLDFHSELLPSFVAMSQADQRTIRFTQSKMSFNHGWLVQGEAPPSPLFAKFKEVMLSEGVAPADVAFYFVHWLTDLAGAEPSPLGGAEKFVLKFPHAVLDSFIRSFSVLNDLAVASETEVMERYLIRTWGETPSRGPAPADEDGVAMMRLALMAQTPEKQSAVLNACAYTRVWTPPSSPHHWPLSSLCSPPCARLFSLTQSAATIA